MTYRPLLPVIVAAAALASSAYASAPPVGPIVNPAVTSVTTTKGALVSIALPVRSGYSWRIARALNSAVVREVSEGEIGSRVVLIFKAVGTGRAKVVVAETRGERAKAYRAVEYDVRVK